MATIDPKALEAALGCYSEGGCSGLDERERREVVTDIITAYLYARPAPIEITEDAERVIDAVMEAERFAPKAIPMGANPPLFDGMQPDNDGPWLNRVDVAKRLRAALQGETK